LKDKSSNQAAFWLLEPPNRSNFCLLRSKKAGPIGFGTPDLGKLIPSPASIHWRELESLLNHVGATVEPSHGARYKVSLNRASGFIHHPHNNSDCSRDLIKQVREFLAHAGVSPSAYET